jgi:methyltransferase (TIGR00027 family)
MSTTSSIRNISDTALWVAIYRARESERPDAIFKDPFARRLAGERGQKIANEITSTKQPAWPFVARTWSFDKIVSDCIREGADTVINLAAGLDARPYRMDLPETLHWVEVDLPDMIDYKEELLRDETPRCGLERVRLDLRDRSARRDLFARITSGSKRALVLTEGLIAYLTREHVSEFSSDLHDQESIKDWATDLSSPALLKMLQKNLSALEKADAPLVFGPEEGPDFFAPLGWQPIEIFNMLKVASKLKRLPLLYRVFALFPDTEGKKPNAIWGGVIRLSRTEN